MYQPLIKFHPYPAIITQVLRIFTLEQLPVDNCRQATTTAEKSNYLKEKPDYPTDNSKIYARLF